MSAYRESASDFAAEIEGLQQRVDLLESTKKEPSRMWNTWDWNNCYWLIGIVMAMCVGGGVFIYDGNASRKSNETNLRVKLELERESASKEMWINMNKIPCRELGK